MSREIHQLGDVFGVAREIPKNYVTRESVDSAFVDSLGRDKHIVIYGSSKQGKTCLRKYNLNESDFITVHCSNKWNLAELHANILKRAGYELTVSKTETISGAKKYSAKFGANLLGLDIGVGGGSDSSKQNTVDREPLELDVNDVNDVIGALKEIEFDKFIVLEDFHYLPVETQRDFSVALKAFHENSTYSFVIIGVWLDENRLTVYNGDLSGRITSINADEWKDEELRAVIQSGARLLNVTFAAAFEMKLIAAAQGSVSVVQDSCYNVCTAHEVYKTQEHPKELGTGTDVAAVVRAAVDQSRGRYNSFLTQFANGFQTTQLELYKWLLLPVIMATTQEFADGMRWSAIRSWLTANHPEGSRVNPGSITQALQYVASLQIQKEIKPIVLDYDETNLRLNIVDRGFSIWLSNQEKGELLERLGLPREPAIPSS